MDAKAKKIAAKTAIFVLSLSLAWWIIKSDHFQSLIVTILPVRFISEIAAGVLYASFLTSPISVAMLVVLAQNNNPILTAILAGAGAALTDILILKFFRKKLSADLNLVSKPLHLQRIEKLLEKFHLNFMIPGIGALIVASPLPDELGLMMLGISKLQYREIAVLTYLLNTAGILLLVTPVNLLS